MTKEKKPCGYTEHYKNYSLKWYLENDARLNAMFRKVYGRYMTDSMHALESAIVSLLRT